MIEHELTDTRLQGDIQANLPDLHAIVRTTLSERTAQEAQGYVELQIDRQGDLHAVRQREIPIPHYGHALIRIVASSFCAADRRVLLGEKAVLGGIIGFATPGHEGMGVVEAVGIGVPASWVGQYVAILPHIYRHNHELSCTNLQHERRGPRCTGWVAIPDRCTCHLGFLGAESRGTFAQYLTLPVENLIPIPTSYIQTVSPHTLDLPSGALFTLFEPVLCVRSALKLAQNECLRRFKHRLVPGRALVLGCGPMGAICGLALKLAGYEVWLHDVQPKRATLVQDRLADENIQVWDCQTHSPEFDFVMVTAPAIEAVYMALDVTEERGTVFLFSGLNALDKEEARQDHSLPFDNLHREGRYHEFQVPTGQTVRVIGSSGYSEEFAKSTVKFITYNARSLSRLVTGRIESLESPVIKARLPGADDLHTPNHESPALIGMLIGQMNLMNHLKVIVLP